MECKPHNITLKRTVAKLKQGSSRDLWIMDYALWLSTKLPLASWLTDLWFDKYEKINAYLRTLQRNMGKNKTDFIVSIGVLKKKREENQIDNICTFLLILSGPKSLPVA